MCDKPMFVYASVKAQGRGKYCSLGCYYESKRRLKKSPEDRLLGKIRKVASGCWLWRGPLQDNGYAKFYFGKKMEWAHRASYIIFRGKIPDGLVLDHLCRVPWCVNPDHLEPVTTRVNILRGESKGAKQARQTHCLRGHPLSGDNLVKGMLLRYKKRICRICANAAQKQKYLRRKANGSVAVYRASKVASETAEQRHLRAAYHKAKHIRNRAKYLVQRRDHYIANRDSILAARRAATEMRRA